MLVTNSIGQPEQQRRSEQKGRKQREQNGRQHSTGIRKINPVMDFSLCRQAGVRGTQFFEMARLRLFGEAGAGFWSAES